MRKTLLLFLMTICVVSCAFFVSSCSRDTGTLDYHGLSFNLLDDGTYEVSGANYSGTDLTIPMQYKGKEVTRIADGAFKDVKCLKSVNILKNITYLGKEAFSGCTNLERVLLADTEDCTGGITSLNYRTFYECTSLKKVTTVANETGKNMFPCTLTKIEDEVFYNCEKLEGDLLFDDSFAEGSFRPVYLESIGARAFYGCKSVTTKNRMMKFKDTLTSIGEEAFSGSGITEIAIPSGIQTIGKGVFKDCKIEELEVPFVWGSANGTTSYLSYLFGASSYSSVGYIPTSLNTLSITGGTVAENDLYKYTEITSITISENTTVAEGALSYCNKLESIDIFIKDEALGNSDKGLFYYLGEGYAKIPSNIKMTVSTTEVDNINGVVFKNEIYKNVSEIKFMGAIKTIEGEAFKNYENLTSVTISKGVINIGEDAFLGCSSIKNIRYGGNVNDWVKISDLKNLMSCNKSEKNLYIDYEDINSKTISKVDINDNSITSIGDYAFYNVKSITKVTIPNSVTNIGDEAFRGCNKLTSITKLDNVTSIGSSAFHGCSSLTSITKLNNVTSMGSSVFYGCSSLTSITIPNGVTVIGDSTFQNCSSLTSITVHNGVTVVGDSAFQNCSKLKKITKFDNVTSIGSSAFYGCSLLTSVTTLDNVTSIGSSAFYGCSKLTSITISNAITTINDSTFQNCSSLTSITIPSNVTSIGASAFYGCSKLTSITIPNGVTIINDSTFYKCSAITTIEIPDDVTSIGSYAFSGCSKLEAITIPNGVTTINDATFQNCSSLTSITIPGNVTSIGSSTFSGCVKLTSVTIPDSVTSIGGSAFADCSSLEFNTYDNAYYLGNDNNPYLLLVKAINTSITSCTIDSNTKFIHSGAFEDCSSLENIYYTGDINSWVQISGLEYLMKYGKSSKNLYINDTLLTEANITTATSINSYAFKGCTSITNVTIGDQVTDIDKYAFSGCDGLTSIEMGDNWSVSENGQDWVALEDISSNAKKYLVEDYCGYSWKRV